MYFSWSKWIKHLKSIVDEKKESPCLLYLIQIFTVAPSGRNITSSLSGKRLQLPSMGGLLSQEACGIFRFRTHHNQCRSSQSKVAFGNLALDIPTISRPKLFFSKSIQPFLAIVFRGIFLASQPKRERSLN